MFCEFLPFFRLVLVPSAISSSGSHEHHFFSSLLPKQLRFQEYTIDQLRFLKQWTTLSMGLPA